MAQHNIPRVFDKNMNRLCYLQNAFEIGYALPLNELWTASFSLPADDAKNSFCQGRNFVEIYDGGRRIELFRIIGEDLTRSTTAVKVYNCEHVLATLLDDVLFQYHQIGNLGVYTQEVLQYILARQETPRWTLSGCDFARQFEYNFENTNLLSALFSVPQCFDSDYRWEWNTEGTPWRLYLRAASTELKSEIRYKKNMTEIRRTIDYSAQVNRLYALGYGEGDNQLTIKEANNGIPYLEDSASQQEHGAIASILIDTRFEYAETLKAYAQTFLSQHKDPYITYEAAALDLYRLSGDDFSLFVPGDVIRVIDTVDNIVVNTRIVSVAKANVRGDPGAVEIVLANKDHNIASSISDLQNRALINETYAQGATNIMVQSFSDNADRTHPAKFRVYFPAEMVRLNKVKLQVEFEPFRGYTRGVESAAQESATASAGGGSTTSSGGGSNTTSGSGGGTEETSSATGLYSSNTQNDPGDDGGPGNANHNHGLFRGARLALTDGEGITGSVVFVPSGKHSHPAHTHEIDIPSHTHRVNIDSHTHTVPSHTHQVTIPSHSHNMEHGIYEGDTAETATIKVDGRNVPVPADWSDINIIDYFAVDGSGKITRDTWHTIEIAPNVMSRIVASVFVQLFCNSRGSGDY